MTANEYKLLKIIRLAQENIASGKVHAAHELLVETINYYNQTKLNPTTGESS